MSQNLNSAVAVIGIDIGKNSFARRARWSRCYCAASEVVARSGRSAAGQCVAVPTRPLYLWRGKQRRQCRNSHASPARMTTAATASTAAIARTTSLSAMRRSTLCNADTVFVAVVGCSGGGERREWFMQTPGRGNQDAAKRRRAGELARRLWGDTPAPDNAKSRRSKSVPTRPRPREAAGRHYAAGAATLRPRRRSWSTALARAAASFSACTVICAVKAAESIADRPDASQAIQSLRMGFWSNTVNRGHHKDCNAQPSPPFDRWELFVKSWVPGK